MNLRRPLLGAVGAASISAVLLAGSAVAPLVPVGDAVAALGNDYFLVAVLGALSLAVAAVVVARGRGVDQSEMPDPERPVSVPAPGDGLTETLDDWRLAVPFAGRRARRAVTSRLRGSAVEAVRRAENCTDDDARERVLSGEWTDDAAASAFLAPDRRLPPGAYLRAIARGEAWFAHGARRAADEIAARERSASARASPGRDEDRAVTE